MNNSVKFGLRQKQNLKAVYAQAYTTHTLFLNHRFIIDHWNLSLSHTCPHSPHAHTHTILIFSLRIVSSIPTAEIFFNTRHSHVSEFFKILVICEFAYSRSLKKHQTS
jgi:hypothetical protein